MSTDKAPKDRDLEDMNFDDLEPKAPPPTMNASQLWFLPPLLQEIAKNGAYFTIGNDGKCQLQGFYKNGNLTLTPDPSGTLIATDKRGRNTTIKNFDDLVKLNFDWWKASTSKQNYVVPQKPWVDAFIEKKWVVRQVIFVPKDDDGKDNSGSDLE